MFNKCLEFAKIFNEWKKLDMEAVICNLAKIYIDLKENLMISKMIRMMKKKKNC